MPEIALEPRPGDSVGPYRITRTIGRGRMGVVFEGVADGGQPVAIKVVTTELSQDEVFVRRFKREVAAAQKIQHPHVVPVLGAGDEGGLPYLVQELIPGGSLHDRIVARPAARPRDDGPAADRPRRGDRRAARERPRAPRHQAREHPARRRPRLRDRLRPGQGQPGLEPDPPGPGARLARLHGAGADPRRGRQRRHRHLRARLHDPRVPDRHAARSAGGRACACCSRTCRSRRRTSRSAQGHPRRRPRRRSTGRWRRSRRTGRPAPPATSSRSPRPPGI